MKLVSYHAGVTTRAGVVLDAKVYDVEMLLSGFAVRPSRSSSLREVLSEHGGGLAALAGRLTAAAKDNMKAEIGPLESVRLAPPITDPAKVLCIGLNYNDHVAETGRALPSHPDVFAKFASTLIGPNEDIRCSHVTQNLDFEGELAVVIGRECRAVAPDQALGYIAGVTVLNDITARDLQYRGTQWLAGKAVDGSTPCGPAIVTLDEIGDVQDLDIKTRVNGVEVQSSNTRYMIFPIRELISYISFFLTLSPGDIITTGTPQGIGAKRQPPLWLKPGDVVEVELQRVGVLRNRVQ
ncbi:MULTISPECIES: fumarylacetoacetate hydrolase family protein [unclassified Rhizobium]|uniref:fumarylacetoacetate hydrolase family protein n=1 Tax=unclassified Rhizobium TaxID=2613769 RepID=UPI0007E9385F|nr:MULTISPECIES: fumarylacetoacetate hydrolase family protein [unclassified Rhizobium]ANM14440.1 fumarylacetoacetate hydrolase protein [Rhizobium sp. N324]ANM20825.1 fumarylacetoacetate hydrolase protein [Rhizobium sp. N541]ANM27208.1 fumarylacetoacetate hydrolase protein [Rhizobium sp. N941]OYC99539.1 fumarylacetoacetate hydrolase protein [Rhizobium sp. N4311]